VARLDWYAGTAAAGDGIEAALDAAEAARRQAAAVRTAADRYRLARLAAESASREWAGANMVITALESAARVHAREPVPAWAAARAEAVAARCWDTYTETRAALARARAVYEGALKEATACGT
jgi:hypothetical protein